MRTAAQNGKSADEDFICIAQIGRPHGVRGGVHLAVFADDADLLLSESGVTDENGRFLFKILRLSGQKNGRFIAEIENIATREAAEALRHVKLHIPRSILPDLDEEDSYYHVDLIGLDVAEEQSGDILGDIVAVQNFGAGDLLEIRKTGKKETFFVPFTRGYVPVVSLAERRVVLDLPQGFFSVPEKPEKT